MPPRTKQAGLPRLRQAHSALESLVNKPLFVAVAVIAAGVSGSFIKDVFSDSRVTTRSEVRLTQLEVEAAESKKNCVMREEFNRLDLEVQSKAGREELLSIQRRIDDVRTDLAEIKTAVLMRSPARH